VGPSGRGAFGEPAELDVAKISRGDRAVPALVADEPKRCASRGWARRVPVNGGVGDVAAAGPHAFAQRRHIGPAESRTRILVVHAAIETKVINQDAFRPSAKALVADDPGAGNRATSAESNDLTLRTKDSGVGCSHARGS